MIFYQLCLWYAFWAPLMQAFSLGEESNKTHTILFTFVDIKIQNNFFCVLFAREYEYFGEFLKKYKNTKKIS